LAENPAPAPGEPKWISIEGFNKGMVLWLDPNSMIIRGGGEECNPSTKRTDLPMTTSSRINYEIVVPGMVTDYNRRVLLGVWSVYIKSASVD
jgi:hypothetical protein